jgi:hypothetical protein
MLFLFLSCPKPAPAVSKQGSLIGHPEHAEKAGFPIKDFGNDKNFVYYFLLLII